MFKVRLVIGFLAQLKYTSCGLLLNEKLVHKLPSKLTVSNALRLSSTKEEIRLFEQLNNCKALRPVGKAVNLLLLHTNRFKIAGLVNVSDGILQPSQYNWVNVGILLNVREVRENPLVQSR